MPTFDSIIQLVVLMHMQERHPFVSLIQSHPVPQHRAPTSNEINTIIVLFFADFLEEGLVKNVWRSLFNIRSSRANIKSMFS